MSGDSLPKATLKVIDGLVRHYEDHRTVFQSLIDQLAVHVGASHKLKQLVHSMKSRTKDPEHLKEKLIRKGVEAKVRGDAFPYSTENLFKKINDLAGFRILHLHTTQAREINEALREIFDEQRWVLLEGPAARTWDDESRQYFKDIGFETVDSPSMYTSVHYVVQPNSRAEVTCEIQVRTLMEEVWGEVDHTINYPVKSTSESCREQIKVLARVTSSCSRLVDSIFLSNSPALAQTKVPVVKPKKKGRRK